MLRNLGRVPLRAQLKRQIDAVMPLLAAQSAVARMMSYIIIVNLSNDEPGAHA